MKTEFDVDNAAKLAIAVSLVISIFATFFFFWPGAAAIGDMVRDKEMNPIVGFFGFILLGIVSPVGSFFAGVYVFAVIHTRIEEIVFSRNRKFKEIAEFIIEARGNK